MSNPLLKVETKKVLVLKDGDNIKGDKFEDYEPTDITYVVGYNDSTIKEYNLITAIQEEEGKKGYVEYAEQ